MIQSLLIAALLSGGISILSDADTSRTPPQQWRSSGEAVPDTLTPDEVRDMIVGTWIEDVAKKLGNHQKGSLRWVFTESGTVQKYEDGKLYATQEYAVVGAYKGKQAPEDIAGYLRFTDQDGEVRYMTLSSIRRDDTFPHLSVGTHGAAGNTETLFFVPARVFE